MRREISAVGQWKVGHVCGNRKALSLFTKRITLGSRTRTQNLRHWI